MIDWSRTGYGAVSIDIRSALNAPGLLGGDARFGALCDTFQLVAVGEVADDVGVNWMDRADRRRRGKSDPLDAQTRREPC
ncbi:hypothetical protein [Streptomyces collinus]|uniref:hypothetical protein n=1 Tax=Streptomyces collinus TaxID=42684 RepID=UPI0036CD4AFF